MPETDKTVDRGHFTMKAAATVTDQGVFEAVISTASIDREKDIVEPSAMVTALKKWNRPIPLAWNHSTDAEDIIGSVEPMTVRQVDREVVVGGTVDLESAKGAEAWRSFRSGTVGFSYGYMVPEGGAKAREGGGKHITELDVFEITATPTPMNNDTRVLTWKAVPPTQDELQKQEQENRLEQATKDVPKGTPPAPDPVEQLQSRVDEIAEQVAALEGTWDKKLEEVKALAKGPARAKDEHHDELRKRSDQAVLDLQLDGISSRKSPAKQDPPPEPLDESELQARSKRVMLELLTGVRNDKE